VSFIITVIILTLTLHSNLPSPNNKNQTIIQHVSTTSTTNVVSTSILEYTHEHSDEEDVTYKHNIQQGVKHVEGRGGFNTEVLIGKLNTVNEEILYGYDEEGWKEVFKEVIKDIEGGKGRGVLELDNHKDINDVTEGEEVVVGDMENKEGKGEYVDDVYINHNLPPRLTRTDVISLITSNKFHGIDGNVDVSGFIKHVVTGRVTDITQGVKDKFDGVFNDVVMTQTQEIVHERVNNTGGVGEGDDDIGDVGGLEDNMNIGVECVGITGLKKIVVEVMEGRK
jgi:hypothetical protein